MSTIASMLVEVGVDASGVDKGVTAADQKVGAFSQTMSKAGAAAGKILAVGLLAAGAAAVKMTAAAAEDDAAAAKLANTLKNAAGATDAQVAATESWITAQGSALGVTDDELRPALSKLVAVTKDVGKAQELASLAMDVSAGSGKSLESVSAALAKAQTGSLGGLAKLGVATKDAAGEALSLEQVQANLAKTYSGAAASAADTVAGKNAILKVRFGELQEEIGTKLLPVLLKASEYGMKVVDWLAKNQSTAGVLIGVMGGLLAVLWAASVASKAAAAATALWSGITKTAAAVQWLLNAAMTANPIGLLVVGIVALVAAAVLAYNKVDWFRAGVDAAFGWIISVGKSVAGFFSGWSLSGTILATWGAIKSGTSAAWNAITEFVKGIPGKLVGFFLNFTLPGLIIKHWQSIKEGTIQVASSIVEWVSGLPGRFVNVLGNLGGRVSEVFRSAMQSGKEKVIGLGGDIVEWISGIPGKIANLGVRFANAGRDLLQDFINGMKNAAGIIEGIASNVWNMVRGLLNGAINKINSALEFSVSVGPKTFGINPPDIPQLAKGGRVTQATLAIIGEGREPESVLPDSKLAGIVARAEVRGMQSVQGRDDPDRGRGDTWNVYETVNAAATAREVSRRQSFAGAA